MVGIFENFENILKPKIELFLESITTSVQVFTGVIALIYIGYKVMVYMANPEDRLDPYLLVKPILILVALALYTELTDLLIFTPIDILGELIRKTSETIAGVSGKDFDLKFRGAITHVQTTGGDGAGVYDLIQINPILEVIHLIIYFIASVVGFYIIFRQLMTKYIYYILGIFVLPFSLIVGNQKVLGKWFFGFLSVLLWIPVLNLLKMIIIILPVEEQSFTNVLFSVGLQIVLIFTILKVPRLANILVEQGTEMGRGIGSQARVAMSGIGMNVARKATRKLRRKNK